MKRYFCAALIVLLGIWVFNKHGVDIDRSDQLKLTEFITAHFNECSDSDTAPLEMSCRAKLEYEIQTAQKVRQDTQSIEAAAINSMFRLHDHAVDVELDLVITDADYAIWKSYRCSTLPERDLFKLATILEC